MARGDLRESYRKWPYIYILRDRFKNHAAHSLYRILVTAPVSWV